MYSEKNPDDGQRNCQKHVEFYSKNKFEKLVHLVGFVIRIYHDARSHEHQKTFVIPILIWNRLARERHTWLIQFFSLEACVKLHALNCASQTVRTRLLTGILRDDSAFIFALKYRHISGLLDSEDGGNKLLHNISRLGIATQNSHLILQPPSEIFSLKLYWPNPNRNLEYDAILDTSCDTYTISN